jgi:hypothetical protein
MIRKANSIQQTLGVILSSVLFIQPAAFSAPGPVSLSTLPSNFIPPSAVATLTSVVPGDASHQTPDILLIQDLHFNYSVQRNISRLLEFFNKQGLMGTNVAVEGATGEVDDSLLTGIKDAKVKEEVSDFLMHNGELTGAQYFAVLHGGALQGVENPELYNANLEIFRQSYGARMRAVRKIDALRTRLSTLSGTLLSSRTQNIDRGLTRVEEGSDSLSSFMKKLDPMATRVGVQRPALLTEYLGCSKERRQEISDSIDLFSVVRDYALNVQVALARTSDEKILIQALRELKGAQLALGEKCTLEQLQQTSRRIDRISGLVVVLAGESGKDALRDIKETLQASVDFYVAALLRNDSLVENTLRLREKAHQGPIALVVGGFHTKKLVEQFHARGLSCAIFRPQVDALSKADETLYARRIMGGRLSESEALAWLDAKEEGQLAPAEPSAKFLGLIPKLSGLSWLPDWIRTAEKAHSFYGQKILSDLRARHVLKLDGLYATPFKDLTHPNFENDERLPGGRELRAVISLFQEAGLTQPGDAIPFRVVHLLKSNNVRYRAKGNDTPIKKKVLSEPEQQNLIEAIRVKEGVYDLYVHEDAILSHPGFQKDPFAFWLMVILHEMAHIEHGADHDELVAAGLASNYDTSWSPRQIIMEWGKFYFPRLNTHILDGAGVEAILALNSPAFHQLRSRKLSNPADLSAKDIAYASDFSQHSGLVPGRDYVPATQNDFVKLPQVIPAEDIRKAAIMEADGSVVEEVFAGGAASRIRGLLNLMDKLHMAPNLETKLLWTVPIKYFPRALFAYLQDIEKRLGPQRSSALDEVWKKISLELKNLSPEMTLEQLGALEDWGHWGARAMIGLNAHVRRQARLVGLNENEALSHKRILFHVSREDLQGMAADFQKHNLYGFGEIIFVVNEPGPYIAADRKIGTFKLVQPHARIHIDGRLMDVGQIVYGHGPATLALARAGSAFILRNQKPLSSPKFADRDVSIKFYLTQVVFPNNRPFVIRENRLNNVGFLNPNVGDVEELAFFNQLRAATENPCYALFRMVINPTQMDVKMKHGENGGTSETLSIDYPAQTGGKSFRFTDDKNHTRVMPVEGSAVGGATNEFTAKFKEMGGHPAEEYLNAMRTLKSGREWLEAVSSQGLSFFYGVYKEPISGELVRLGDREGIVLKPQTATGHLALLPSLGAQAFIARNDNPHEIFAGHLTDLKTPDVYQSLRALRFTEKQDKDPLVMALAYKFGFDIKVNLRSSEQFPREVLHELDLLNNIAPLNSKQAHVFTLISGLLLAAVFVFSGGILAAGIVGAYAASAVTAEIAIAHKAIQAGDVSLLNSDTPVATYDLVNQKETVSDSLFAIGAHAHELARALTQSSSPIIPRLIVPFTLLLAIIDRGVSVILKLIKSVLNTIRHLLDRSSASTVAPDAEMLGALQSHRSLLESLLAAPVVAQLQAGSGWWVRIRTGIAAVYKNSEAREQAEAAARQAIYVTQA